MGTRSAIGLVIMLFSAFFFAISGPVAKALYEIAWTPGAVTLVRLTGSSVLLLVPTLIVLRGKWFEVTRHWRTIVAYGLISMTGVQLFYFLAVEHLSVAVALMLEMMGAPLIVVFWVWVHYGQRPLPVTWTGIVACLIGVCLMLDIRGAPMSWFGVVMALAAAACMAVYFMMSANYSHDVPPIAVTGLGMSVGSLGAVLLCLTPLLPVQFSTNDAVFAQQSVTWWIPVVLLVLFTIGAYACGILSLRFIGATVGSFVNLVEIPFSAVAAWWLLGEELTTWQLTGGISVLAGIAFVKLGDMRMQHQRPTKIELRSSTPEENAWEA